MKNIDLSPGVMAIQSCLDGWLQQGAIGVLMDLLSGCRGLQIHSSDLALMSRADQASAEYRTMLILAVEICVREARLSRPQVEAELMSRSPESIVDELLAIDGDAALHAMLHRVTCAAALRL